MILVVASRVDDAARRLVRDLPAGSVQLLTPRDLSEAGWRVDPRDPAGSMGMADGRRVEARRVTGVVCLLPHIFPDELVHIEPADRVYVAAEMTAFLSFWLSGLECPKLNPPTAGCLSGPRWPAERWLAEAASVSIPVQPLRRSTRTIADPDPPLEDGVTITVVGRHALGHEDGKLSRRARALASAAGVDLLSVQFLPDRPGCPFGGADPFPDLSDPRAAGAIWDHFHPSGRS